MVQTKAAQRTTKFRHTSGVKVKFTNWIGSQNIILAVQSRSMSFLYALKLSRRPRLYWILWRRGGRRGGERGLIQVF